MKCQHCNSEIPDNSSFCPNCGQKAASAGNGPEKKFCDNCGAPLEQGRGFCPSCGKPVTGNTQQNAAFDQKGTPYTTPYNYSSSAAGQQPGKKNKKAGMIIAIIVILVVVAAGIVGIAGFFVFSDKKDEKVSEVTVAQDETEENAAEDNITDEDNSDGNITDEDGTGSADSDSGDLITGRFESLEDFVNSDIVQQQLEAQFSSLEGTGMSLELTAERPFQVLWKLKKLI